MRVPSRRPLRASGHTDLQGPTPATFWRPSRTTRGPIPSFRSVLCFGRPWSPWGFSRAGRGGRGPVRGARAGRAATAGEEPSSRRPAPEAPTRPGRLARGSGARRSVGAALPSRNIPGPRPSFAEHPEPLLRGMYRAPPAPARPPPSGGPYLGKGGLGDARGSERRRPPRVPASPRPQDAPELRTPGPPLRSFRYVLDTGTHVTEAETRSPGEASDPTLLSDGPPGAPPGPGSVNVRRPRQRVCGRPARGNRRRVGRVRALRTCFPSYSSPAEALSRKVFFYPVGLTPQKERSSLSLQGRGRRGERSAHYDPAHEWKRTRTQE